VTMPQTVWGEIEDEPDPGDADVPQPRIGGTDSHAGRCELEGEDYEWDPSDLEWRAQESAALDAHESGLIFA
jgi:hypothetical protein